MNKGINPIISVFSSAVRHKLWMPLYENLSTSKVPFEIIFVGGNRPSFDLPTNVRYVYSNVKPAQCYYIAAHYCRGEFLFCINDDFIFSDGALDQMLKAHSEWTLTSPRYPRSAHGGCDNKTNFQTIGLKEHNLPQPVGFLINKSLWDTLSIDKNFVSMFWDLDIFMRLNQMGVRTDILENVHVIEKKATNMSRDKKGFGDKLFFFSIWHGPKHADGSVGDLLPERRIPVQELQWTDDVLITSQGTINERWD